MVPVLQGDEPGEGERSYTLYCTGSSWCDVGVNINWIERVKPSSIEQTEPNVCARKQSLTRNQIDVLRAVYPPNLHIASILAKIRIKSCILLWGCGALDVDRAFLLCLLSHRVFLPARSLPDAGLFDWMGHLAPTPRKTSGWPRVYSLAISNILPRFSSPTIVH